ncbi:DNA-directed RNA polymerase specialized sigma24 family protein [Paenibacillus sp. DS2015]|uniref:helix-turn-helix domain-containing protein n=1 Tax=Paenibacillus sp. DS2015 TaxID=3373917 RepID=UPI003D1C0EE4
MMTSLLLKVQLNDDKEAMAQILEAFTPKIISSLRQVPVDYREDLKQELYVKMIEVIKGFDIVN